jgi:thioredoxin-dependent peroxiredoxin
LIRHARSGVPSSVLSSPVYELHGDRQIGPRAVDTPARARILALQIASRKASKGRHIVENTPETPQAGDKAPAFALPRDGGGTVSLKDFAGKKLVLYFYPRADTPGCTKEAIEFSKLKTAFTRAGTEILGVSADPVPAQDKFKAKHKLSIALASDEKHKMLEAYGVWQEKSMYGRKFLGVVRATFLIGPDQRIAQVWPKVSVAGHAEEVLAAAKDL